MPNIIKFHNEKHIEGRCGPRPFLNALGYFRNQWGRIKVALKGLKHRLSISNICLTCLSRQFRIAAAEGLSGTKDLSLLEGPHALLEAAHAGEASAEGLLDMLLDG